MPSIRPVLPCLQDLVTSANAVDLLSVNTPKFTMMEFAVASLSDVARTVTGEATAPSVSTTSA
jgi:hypothetical protein